MSIFELSEGDRSAGVAGVERAAFWLTVLSAGATFWIARRPPMEDLAQHAAQIALWHDLVLGTSKWQGLFYVNYFTPYVVASGLGLLLSFVMPVISAVKLLLSLSYYAFVLACRLLRAEMKGDSRLDWLFIPAFFGLAYEYGFFPFLVAAPLGIAFITLAGRLATHPTTSRGAVLFLTGLALFFTHGLVFLFATAIGGAFLLLRQRSWRGLVAGAISYAGLAVLCLAYLLLRPGQAESTYVQHVAVRWPGLFSALKHLIFFPIGAPKLDWLLAPLVPLLLCVPFALGCRLNRRNKAAFVPLSVLLLWSAFMPDFLMDTWFIGSRFAIFLPTFWALVFSAPLPRAGPSWGRLMAPALSLAFLAIHVDRLSAFAAESRSFEEVLAAAEPDSRALSLVTDITSLASRNPMAYVSFPMWYQVEKSGLAEPNFARFATQVVRYRSGAAPAEGYRYLFVRHTGALPSKLFPAGVCEPVLRKSSGNWSLFESAGCQ